MREVAGSFQLSGNGDVANALRAQLSLEFLRHKKVELVLSTPNAGTTFTKVGQDNRATDRVTKVIEAEELTRKLFAIVYPVVGVESFVAMIQITAAMELVAAALCHHADLRTRRASIFCLVV